MKLTGGVHNGRLLKVPADGTRPTQDKVRAAIFSSLASIVPGARVLDLFAGTGALGLEAWSRGAAWVEWVENGRHALTVLKTNVKNLGVPSSSGRIVAADALKRLASAHAGEPFDLVLADPPYAEAKAGDWQGRMLTELAQNQWLRPGGLFVFETEGRSPLSAVFGWRLARDKAYGATRVLLWVWEP
ncbi:MAG: 16S rRNA (guanine(966)-N(2))-methyltransferase RsmD [Verrucomicrobiota bacterium]|jgi:16S rRNA (guanine966-N2)-methyltransferase|nr:16S rRNA (guanine(966)-N(2))-methyltransferase RsmD [Verrucomicrobiota bacterium]